MHICLFLAMHTCVCGEHIKDMCQFSHSSFIANTLRPQWSERHLRFAQSKPNDAYMHWWSTMLSPLQELIATVYKAGAIIEISEYFPTIVLTFCKIRFLSDILWDYVLHGPCLLLQGFFSSCRLPWFCNVYGIRWRSQRSRGDEVMLANAPLVSV